MTKFREYRGLIFLCVYFGAPIIAWIVPSWSGTVYRYMVVVGLAAVAWFAVAKLNRIEDKLDAILEKLSKD
jgi:hypothetical protein